MMIYNLLACSLCYLIPAILGDIWDMSSMGIEYIKMKSLFMFWGGMVYLNFLKKRV
jgi:hypothetical protein